jgi:hypothetical protein
LLIWHFQRSVSKLVIRSSGQAEQQQAVGVKPTNRYSSARRGGCRAGFGSTGAFVSSMVWLPADAVDGANAQQSMFWPENLSK